MLTGKYLYAVVFVVLFQFGSCIDLYSAVQSLGGQSNITEQQNVVVVAVDNNVVSGADASSLVSLVQHAPGVKLVDQKDVDVSLKNFFSFKNGTKFLEEGASSTIQGLSLFAVGVAKLSVGTIVIVSLCGKHAVVEVYKLSTSTYQIFRNLYYNQQTSKDASLNTSLINT